MNTNAPANDPPQAARRSILRGRPGWGFPVVLAGIVVGGIILARSWHKPAKASTDNVTAIPVVAVSKVDREDLYREITIPAEFRAYNEVDVHAKVSGYVQRMNVDIGDKVKAGQLLALLEIPELGDELDHAIATHQRAAADYKDAHLAYSRLVEVNKDHPNLIAQQDLDTAEAKDATAEGALAATKSDVEKYHTLVSYTRITAPFGGVVTKRYADPGALIQAGTASQTQAMPLVRVSDNNLLRLDFPVSVDYVRGIRTDAPVSVHVDSLGDRVFEGKIARFANRIDDSTRTMIVEMEVPNPSLELVPGMYANVTLKVDQRPHALAIPIEAVPPGGKSILVVNASHQVEERPIKLGLETAAKYEVLSGLNEGDLVMLGNPAQLTPGQKVEAKITEPLARQ
ncbi:MAG: Efflux transporter, family, subunit [Gammaproteobacteria bacterium]|jgi:RND family efflux transporter MFP subunit|nr:Efflux transporter, family, subunit [Gammaproteobacteria bacterium]